MAKQKLTVNQLSSNLYQVLNPDKVSNIHSEVAEIIRNESIYLNDSVVITEDTLNKAKRILNRDFSYSRFSNESYVTILIKNSNDDSVDKTFASNFENFMKDRVFLTQFEFMGYIFNGMKKFAEENGLQFSVQKLFSVTYEIGEVSDFTVSNNPYEASDISVKELVSINPIHNPLSTTSDKTLPGVFSNQKEKDEFLADSLNKILEGVSK